LEKKNNHHSRRKIKAFSIKLQGVKAAMKEKIKQFMKETFLLELNEDITEDSDLFRLGVINSIGYIKLIDFLEQEFNIRFSEEEILSNIFVTLSSILECVENKVKG